MKILFTADVHINDYHPYNLEPGFRLQQFVRLADRMVQVIREHGVERVIIAGDLIHVPVIRPHIQHVVWQFVKKLAAECQVDIIVGNHDADSKNAKMEDGVTLITLLNDLNNVRVLNHHIETIDGMVFGYQSWQPEHPLDWYEGTIDVLVNHFTDAGFEWTGQTIDESRFHAMFFGDIHKPYQKGKLVSIGNPIGHRLGDYQDGTLLIADTEGASYSNQLVTSNGIIGWEWIDTIVPGEFDFLRIYRPDKKPVNAGQYKYDVEVPYPVVRTNSTDSSDLVYSIDVDSVMAQYIKEYGLDEVHNRVLHEWNLQGFSTSTVPLKFELVSIDIKNYRSIESLSMNFTGGVTLLAGNIGSGKTTIISAIEYALLGNSRISSQIKLGSDGELFVDLVLVYQNVYYRIKRGNGQCQLWVGTEDEVCSYSRLDTDSDKYHQPVPFNSIRDCSNSIWERLPFLQHWRLMYIDQMSVGLFASMSQGDRINMLSKLLGWESVSQYHNMAYNLKGLIEQEITASTNSVAVLEGSIKSLTELGLEPDPTNYEVLIDSATKEIDNLRSISDKFKSLNSLKQEYAREHARLDSIDTSLPVFNPPEGFHSMLDPDQCRNLIITSMANTENDISSIQGRIVTLNDEIRKDNAALVIHEGHKYQATTRKSTRIQLLKQADDLNHSIKACDEKIGVLGKKLGNTDSDQSCSVCNQKLLTPEAISSYHASVQSELLSEMAALVKLKSDQEVILNDLNTDIDIDYDKNVEHLESAISSINDRIIEKTGEVATLEMEIANLRRTIDQSKSQLSEIAQHEVRVEEVQKRVVLKESIKDGMHKLATEIDSLESELNGLNQSDTDNSISILTSQVSEYHVKASKALDTAKRIIRVSELEQEVASIKEQITKSESEIEELQKYLDLTHRNGVVVRSILETCAKMLSTDSLRVTTVRELSSGELSPDLSLELEVNGNLIPYNNLSGGQLFVADIRFLLSLIEMVGGVGILMLDEVFKYLSPEYIDVLAAEIKECNARDIFVVTHADNYPYNDRVIRAELDATGTSQYSITNTH